MFRIIYIDNSDVIAQERRRRDAVSRLAAFLDEHPSVTGDIGIQEIDSAGLPIGQLLRGPLSLAAPSQVGQGVERGLLSRPVALGLTAAVMLGPPALAGSSETLLPTHPASHRQYVVAKGTHGQEAAGAVQD